MWVSGHKFGIECLKAISIFVAEKLTCLDFWSRHTVAVSS